MGAPFLLTHPIAYIHRSFEFSRQFLYEWTVNWKCIPEEIFISRFFHMVLLVLHVTTLLIFNNKFLRFVYKPKILTKIYLIVTSAGNFKV